jgi:hypothetical protein
LLRAAVAPELPGGAVRAALWHRQGETWALIGARVGQRSPSVTADTYTHVLLDDRELDHARLIIHLEERD